MIWRSHGANPEKLYSQMDIEMPEKIIDFSTNTNVTDCDMNYDFDIKKVISEYPDDESMVIREKLAGLHSMSPDNFLIVNGTNAAIYMIVALYKKIAVLQPTYSEYTRAVNSLGKELVNIDLPEEVPDDVDLLIICNPNNPTGEYIDRKRMEKLINFCNHNGTDVIIDEAYVDFLCCNYSMVDKKLLNSVYIMRSMTKIYHLSGIRLGYIISSQEKIVKLKGRQPTWSVNSLAQSVGIMFLENSEFIKVTKEYYEKEVGRFQKEIKNLGYNVLPSAVHYFLLETDDDEKLILYMLKKGIVIRHTRNFHGINGKYVRVCTRERENNDIFIKALLSFRELT